MGAVLGRLDAAESIYNRKPSIDYGGWHSIRRLHETCEYLQPKPQLCLSFYAR